MPKFPPCPQSRLLPSTEGFFISELLMPNELAHEVTSRAPELMQKVGAASAGTSGFVAFVGNNASFFTACGAIIGATVAIAGFVWQYRTTKARRREERALFEARMAALKVDHQ